MFRLNHIHRILLVLLVMGALTAGRAAAQAQDPSILGFKNKFFIEISNPMPVSLDNYAVILDVADIRAFAADFNTYNYLIFEEARGEYMLVVSQADDLDGDRYHDEIVFIRTLPAKSTTRLVCYYSPTRSLQIMPTPKAEARTGWERGVNTAGWESNLSAYKFLNGRIEFYGKLHEGPILRWLPTDERRIQDWGMNVLDAGDSPGLGGLSLWDGDERLPLYGPAGEKAKLSVLSSGPIRALVKAEYEDLPWAGGKAFVTKHFSIFADNTWSRHDVFVDSEAGGPVVIGPGLKKLPGETWSLNEAKSFLASWGRSPGAGEVGLAAIFPPADFAGLKEDGQSRTVRIKGRAGKKMTYWVAGSWDRGIIYPSVPASANWAFTVEGLAARLLAPVKVEYKAR